VTNLHERNLAVELEGLQGVIESRFASNMVQNKKFSDLLTHVVKRILKKYKYPPDKQESSIEQVLQQAKVMGGELE
jgi:type I restriction enzyme R subunit